VFAQSGPITSQSLFFNQGSNAYRGNHLEVDGGVLYTDNVFLQPGSGHGATLGLLGLEGDIGEQRPRFDYRLSTDVALVKYLPADFEAQPSGYLDGAARLFIVPGLFSWTGRDTYSQVALSQFQPITPDNLESINYASTGPRLTLLPTLRTSLVVDVTYSYVYSSSKSPLYVNVDNHRYAGDITLSRAFSDTSSAYINASSEKVDFTDQVDNTNFREDQAKAGYSLRDARTALDLSAGYEKLHELGVTTTSSVVGPGQSAQSQAPRGTQWRVDLSRVIRPTQRVSVHASKQITDTSSLFRLNVDQAVPTTVPNRILTGQAFSYRDIGVTWRIEGRRTAFQIDAVDISQRYRATPTLDADSKVVLALLARQLSPVLNWDIGGNYEHDDYTAGGRRSSWSALTSLRWSVGERLRLRFLYAHSAQVQPSYHVNEFGLVAYYTVIGARPTDAPAELTPQMQPRAPMSSQQPR